MTVKEEDVIKKRSIVVDTEDEEELLEKSDQPKVDKEAKTPTENSGILFYLLAHHQWIFAIWLVPISIFYDIFWWVRARWNYVMCKRNANLRHDEKVRITLIYRVKWSNLKAIF